MTRSLSNHKPNRGFLPYLDNPRIIRFFGAPRKWHLLLRFFYQYHILTGHIDVFGYKLSF
jgi:hypothetical protein